LGIAAGTGYDRKIVRIVVAGALCALGLAVLAAPVAARSDARQFSGVGGQTLTPFRLAAPATLRWQTSGGILGGLFALKTLNARADTPNRQLVFSKARSGTLRLAPGLWKLRVDAMTGTRWQIVVG